MGVVFEEVCWMGVITGPWRGQGGEPGMNLGTPRLRGWGDEEEAAEQ